MVAKKRIEAGISSRSDKRVTIREVAAMAEVSIGTVSRVINGHPHVRDEARKKVLDAAKQLGYVPDAVAQSMRLRSIRAIGCMVSDVANPLFASVVSAAEKVFHTAGFNMILANSSDDPQREIEILSLFKRRRLDGAILTISRDTEAETIDFLARYGLPIVLLERTVESNSIDYVATDHFHGLTQALDYLFSLNHTRIALITVPPTSLPGRARIQAYKAAYERIGKEVDMDLVATNGIASDHGFAAAQSLLTMHAPPTAIIAGANQMVGVLNAIRSLGIEVPRDLSLISLGDMDLNHLYAPPITSVRWKPKLVGKMAAEILIDHLANPDARHRQRKVILATELVVRQSCAPCASPETP